jgi:ankyrin repeat protein
MRLLLEHGADPNGVDPEGLTPLHWASTKEAAQILLRNGADPRIKNSAGLTALEYHRALEMRETEVTRFLALRRSGPKPEPASDPKAKRARTS